jgi:hypothetical protein
MWPALQAAARDDFEHSLPKPLPSGSEGPLEVSWTHGKDGYSYMSTATVIGDLRDFGLERVPELDAWWRQATDPDRLIDRGATVRAAVMQVRVEFHEPTYIWQAGETTEEEEDK